MRTPALQIHARRRQRGLTLIELMVGLTLGMLVTAGMLVVLANASTNGQNLNRVSVQVETGRYVSELLTEDLRLAGFYGELPLATATYTVPDPCNADANPAASPNWGSAPFKLPTPVRGYGAADVLGCLGNRKAGTDALAMRRVSATRRSSSSVPSSESERTRYSQCGRTTPSLPHISSYDDVTGRYASNSRATSDGGESTASGIELTFPYAGRASRSCPRVVRAVARAAPPAPVRFAHHPHGLPASLP